MRSYLETTTTNRSSLPIATDGTRKEDVMKRRHSRVRLVGSRSGQQLASEWDKVAAERDSLIEEGRDLSYLHILLPALRDLGARWLRPGSRILDVGCGTGKFAADIAQASSQAEVVAIDPSSSSIKIARERRTSPTNLVFDCSSIESFAEKQGCGRFNLVVANMLFQNVASLDAALEACAKLLVRDGALVFAVPHPCFWPRYWKYDKEPWFRYDRELWIEAPFRTSLSPDTGVTTTHTHRPLSGYVSAFHAAGLCIDELVEPYPDAGLEGEYPLAWEFPRFLLGRCVIRGEDLPAGLGEDRCTMASKGALRAWVVGDVATDIILAASHFPRPGDDVFCKSLQVSVGGCGSNMAFMLARLGIHPTLVASVGNDLRGKVAVAELNGAGVDTTFVSMIKERETHLTVVVVTPDGERTIFGHTGASEEVVTSSMVELQKMTSTSALLVSGYLLFKTTRRQVTEDLVSGAAKHGVPVILDLPVMIPPDAHPAIINLLPDLDTLIVGAKEACDLANLSTVSQAFAWLADRTPRALIKNGSDELLCSVYGEAISISPPAVTAVDSTGAGDVFCGTFAAARISGLLVSDALAVSCSTAAVSTTQQGVFLPAPRDVLSVVPVADLKRVGLSDAGLDWLKRLAAIPGRAD